MLESTCRLVNQIHFALRSIFALRMMLSCQSLASYSGRWSLPPSTASDRLPAGPHSQTRQKTDAHRSSNIHKGHVAPVNGIPTEHVPVYVPSHSIDAIEMTEIGKKQADQ